METEQDLRYCILGEKEFQRERHGVLANTSLREQRRGYSKEKCVKGNLWTTGDEQTMMSFKGYLLTSGEG